MPVARVMARRLELTTCSLALQSPCVSPSCAACRVLPVQTPDSCSGHVAVLLDWDSRPAVLRAVNAGASLRSNPSTLPPSLPPTLPSFFSRSAPLDASFALYIEHANLSTTQRRTRSSSSPSATSSRAAFPPTSRPLGPGSACAQWASRGTASATTRPCSPPSSTSCRSSGSAPSTRSWRGRSSPPSTRAACRSTQGLSSSRSSACSSRSAGTACCT